MLERRGAIDCSVGGDERARSRKTRNIVRRRSQRSAVQTAYLPVTLVTGPLLQCIRDGRNEIIVALSSFVAVRESRGVFIDCLRRHGSRWSYQDVHYTYFIYILDTYTFYIIYILYFNLRTVYHNIKHLKCRR